MSCPRWVPGWSWRSPAKPHLEGLILAVMASGPCHGYEVIRRLMSSSDGIFDLPEGTVYPALHRSERATLLDSAWETVEGHRRRVYLITVAGRVRLGERREGWRCSPRRSRAFSAWWSWPPTEGASG
jgi:PadR family transcriptional regulator PadR